MLVLAWIMVTLWVLVLFSTARSPLRRLPIPSERVPPYLLWLPDGGDAPSLEPAPAEVLRGATPPASGSDQRPEQILVLGAGVQVSVDLPARLAACGEAFVSVLPLPRGGPLALAVERLRRDFANPLAVTDLLNPAGYADPRCAWLRRSDLDLPGVGASPVLRAARARKAHGLGVDLRDPRGPLSPDAGRHGEPLVTAPAQGLTTHRAGFDDLVASDPLVRALLLLAPTLLCLTPLLLLLHPGTFWPAVLALGLGAAARLMTAVRDGFGAPLVALGWILEPALALGALGAQPRSAHAVFPELPPNASPSLTGAAKVERGAFLDAAAVPFLARRLGGSASVMEQLYTNQPAGRTALGRGIDRAIHAGVSARAVRHRRLCVVEAARRFEPKRLLSVPCGGGGDAAMIGAGETVLVDPGPAARALAQAANPKARVVDATVASAPTGPYDVVLYVGLAEYLDDAEVVEHLGQLRGRLCPEGALITTTTAPHDEQSNMARWLGWTTRGRTVDALTQLLDMAGYEVARRMVDPMGVQWVIVARPRPTA